MNTDEMSKRYLNDPVFYQAVNSIHSMIYNGLLTISEVRDAAFFAGIKFESERIIPMIKLKP